MSIWETAIGALGGGTVGVIATALAKRSASRDASATAVVAPLLERIGTLERDRDEDRREMKTAHESYLNAMQSMREGIVAMREADLEECRRSTAIAVERECTPLREQLARMAEVTASTRASTHGEDTGVHDLRDLARAVRRSPTPPEPIPAQPGPQPALVPRRPPPPPKRRERAASDAAAFLPLAVALTDVLTDDEPSDDGHGD